MKYFINTPLFRSKIQLFTTNTKLEDFYSVQYMLVGASVYSHTNEEEPQIIRGFTTPSFLIDSLKSKEENNRMYHFPIMDVNEENISSGDSKGELKQTKTIHNKYDGFAEHQEWRPETKFERRGINEARPITELYFVKDE
jgi:hypothetical protein